MTTKEWRHNVAELFGTDAVDTYREFVLFSVPVPAVLLRTIIDVTVSSQLTIGAAPFPEQFVPPPWFVGDTNSDVGPHPDSTTLANDLGNVPVLAHGQCPLWYSVTNRPLSTDGNLGVLDPLTGQDITLTHNTQTNLYVNGYQHVDSQAQRRFFDADPTINVSIFNGLVGTLGFNTTNPLTWINVRTLWEAGF
jgi:hypothetical protein